MPVHRERVDPVRTPDGRLLVHRRWILPDDLTREVPLTRLAALWRGLAELELLNPSEEVTLDRLALPPEGRELERQELPAIAGAGALLGGSGAASLITQVVWLENEERRDPYAQEGESDVGGWRDYTLYAVAHERFLLMPLLPLSIVCAACNQESETTSLAGSSASSGTSANPSSSANPSANAAGAGGTGLWQFGEAALLDLSRKCPLCSAALDLGRDRARLRNGAVFLLEESCARAALSIELPTTPEAEELPDAKVARLLIDAFGGVDELADDQTSAAQ